MHMGKYVSKSGYDPLKPKLENPSVGVTGRSKYSFVMTLHVYRSQSVRDTCVSSDLCDNFGRTSIIADYKQAEFYVEKKKKKKREKSAGSTCRQLRRANTSLPMGPGGGMRSHAACSGRSRRMHAHSAGWRAELSNLLLFTYSIRYEMLGFLD